MKNSPTNTRIVSPVMEEPELFPDIRKANFNLPKPPRELHFSALSNKSLDNSFELISTIFKKQTQVSNSDLVFNRSREEEYYERKFSQVRHHAQRVRKDNFSLRQRRYMSNTRAYPNVPYDTKLQDVNYDTPFG